MCPGPARAPPSQHVVREARTWLPLAPARSRFPAVTTYDLAQLNIGRILAPLDSPELAGFVARLADINALADTAPGFVWRLQTEDGDATAFRPYADDRMLRICRCG
jgi:hypothetical protein